MLIAKRSDVSDRELESFGFIRHEQSRRQAFTSSGAIGQSLANNFLGALLLPLYPNKPVNTPYEQEKEKESQFSHSAIAFVHGGLCPSTYEELLPFPTLINTIAKDLVARLQGFLAANTKKLRFGMGSHIVFFSVLNDVHPSRRRGNSNCSGKIALSQRTRTSVVPRLG